MSSVNKAILIGRCGKDPEVRYTQDNMAMASVSLATSRKTKGEEVTDWHNLRFFGKLAEIVEQWVKKGQQLYVEGSIQTRKWTDKEGIDRYTTEIIVNSMIMLGGKSENDGFDRAPRQQKPQQYGQPKPQAQDIGDMDSDIPF